MNRPLVAPFEPLIIIKQIILLTSTNRYEIVTRENLYMVTTRYLEKEEIKKKKKDMEFYTDAVATQCCSDQNSNCSFFQKILSFTSMKSSQILNLVINNELKIFCNLKCEIVPWPKSRHHVRKKMTEMKIWMMKQKEKQNLSSNEQVPWGPCPVRSAKWHQQPSMLNFGCYTK